ncbi:MAG: hypothetical protein ACRBFS_19440 [Aureispira sp.]
MSYKKYNTRIIAYNDYDTTGNFSCNAYWGGGHKVELYLDGREYRSTPEIEVEEYLDSYDRPNRYNTVQTERFVISVVCAQSIVASLQSIDMYDNIELQKLDENGLVLDEYIIRNVDFDDQGDALQLNSKIEISFQRYPVRRPTGGDIRFVTTETIGWDTTGDGLINTGPNGATAPFTGGYAGHFFATQIYQNLHGNSKIRIEVIATRQNGTSRTIGLFQGKIGSLLSDGTNWQGGVSMWRYFRPTDEIGNNQTFNFDKRRFAEDNDFLSDEANAKSVELTFNLRTTRGDVAPLHLPFVYSVWGGFSSAGVYSATTGESSVVTIGNPVSANTLMEMQSYRVPYQPVGSAADKIYSSFIRVETNPTFSRYSIGTAGVDEYFYDGRALTTGEYFFTWKRATYDNDNFTFSVNESNPITHTPQVIASSTARVFTFFWKYDRQTGSGGYPLAGGVVIGNPPKIYLDGNVIATLSGITPTTSFLSGSISITLPDTEIHEVTLAMDTTTGQLIGTEFECQIKPIY